MAQTFTTFTDITDFRNPGELKLTVNPNAVNDLVDVFLPTEREVLRDLIGDRLRKQLQDDLDLAPVGEPTSQKWKDFVDGVFYTPLVNNTDDIDVDYRGIKRMLGLFIFWQYGKDYGLKRTSTGVVNINSENGDAVDQEFVNSVIIPKYQQAINLFNEACRFINDHTELTVIYDAAVEGAPGEYTFNVVVAGTFDLYLSVGDTFTVEGNEFTVVSNTVGTDVVASSSAGLTLLQDGSFTYDAFDGWKFTQRRKMLLV